MHDDSLRQQAGRADLLVAAAAAVVTAVVFVLIAVALGTADCSTGRPGPAGARTTPVVAALALVPVVLALNLPGAAAGSRRA